jgi:hypothetical protein
VLLKRVWGRLAEPLEPDPANLASVVAHVVDVHSRGADRVLALAHLHRGKVVADWSPPDPFAGTVAHDHLEVRPALDGRECVHWGARPALRGSSHKPLERVAHAVRGPHWQLGRVVGANSIWAAQLVLRDSSVSGFRVAAAPRHGTSSDFVGGHVRCDAPDPAVPYLVELVCWPWLLG